MPSRAAWLGARARNVRRRRGRSIGIGMVVFVLMLVGYLLLPRGAAGLRARRSPAHPARVDTSSLRQRVATARVAVALADSALAEARRGETEGGASDSGTVLAGERSTREDSLALAANALAALLRRAATAPLAESYRSLGESPELRGDSRARALIDSLTDVERERDKLTGAVVDPAFVALTTRANALGRGLQAIGERRLEALRREASAHATSPSAEPIDPSPGTLRDTASRGLARDSAIAALADAQRGLTAARRTNAARDSIAASEGAQLRLAPFPVLFLGAAAVAWAVTFAAALIDEMRSPRVADAAEAERLTGLRVLTLASRRSVPADRSRRAADRDLVALLDPTSDAYRILAWHVTSVWPREGIVTVTGDVPVVSAVVGANLAAVLAVDARATLLVDTDFEAEPVRGVLELPQSQGLAAVLENRRRWSETLLTVAVGRDRSMDVLPAGRRERPVGPAEGQALKNDILRAARRHDATIVVTPGTLAPRLRAGDDVIVCAVSGTTRLSTLARAVASLIDAGANARGVVLWEGPLPVLSPRAT